MLFRYWQSTVFADLFLVWPESVWGVVRQNHKHWRGESSLGLGFLCDPNMKMIPVRVPVCAVHHYLEFFGLGAIKQKGVICQAIHRTVSLRFSIYKELYSRCSCHWVAQSAFRQFSYECHQVDVLKSFFDLKNNLGRLPARMNKNPILLDFNVELVSQSFFDDGVKKLSC